MSAPPSEVLDAARLRAGLDRGQLWIGYCSVGGSRDPATVDSYLAGTRVPSRREYDLLAQTLNDSFLAVGLDHLVPYADEFPPDSFTDPGSTGRVDTG